MCRHRLLIVVLVIFLFLLALGTVLVENIEQLFG